MIFITIISILYMYIYIFILYYICMSSYMEFLNSYMYMYVCMYEYLIILYTYIYNIGNTKVEDLWGVEHDGEESDFEDLDFDEITAAIYAYENGNNYKVYMYYNFYFVIHYLYNI